MKKLMTAALVAQLASASGPASAAELVERETPRMAAFAGAPLRLALGGDARQARRLRADLTLAPTMRSVNEEGASRLAFGEGIELGIAGRDRFRLSLAG